MLDAIVFPDGGNWSVIVGSRVRSDPANDRCGGSDGTQCDVTQCHLGRCIILFLPLLHSKSNADAFRDLRVESSCLMSHPFLKEAEILESEYFGELFFLLLDFDIFAQQAHGTKESNYC